MAETDFGNTAALFLDGEASPRVHFGDFGNPELRSNMRQARITTEARAASRCGMAPPP